jgi:hypothetical protein
MTKTENNKGAKGDNSNKQRIHRKRPFLTNNYKIAVKSKVKFLVRGVK